MVRGADFRSLLSDDRSRRLTCETRMSTARLRTTVGQESIGWSLALTTHVSGYSRQKIQNGLKAPKRRLEVTSHHRMKTLLLVATVLAGGVAFAHAGVTVSIGIGIPLPPLTGVVIRQPAPICPAPVVVAPRVCAPRVVAPCAPIWYPRAYAPRYHRYDCAYVDRHGHGRGHGYYAQGNSHRH